MKSTPLRTLLTATVIGMIAAGCGGDKEAPKAPAEETKKPATAPAPAAPPATKPSPTPTPAPAAPGATPAPAAAATPAPAQAVAAASVATASGQGSIKGKVKFEGTAPERAKLDTEGDPKCHAMHAADPLRSDREVVGADGGVRWAFAYIKNAPKGDYPVPSENVDLNQIGCAYSPHVLGIRVGQKLLIKNTDPTLHNVRAIARANKPINFAQPEGTPPRERIFDQVEMEIKLKCDIHSWMTGYLFAMDHPFFDVSNETGAFEIKGLPAGDYTLVVWHEAYGSKEIPVSVKPGEAATADVSFKAAS